MGEAADRQRASFQPVATGADGARLPLRLISLVFRDRLLIIVVTFVVFWTTLRVTRRIECMLRCALFASTSKGVR